LVWTQWQKEKSFACPCWELNPGHPAHIKKATVCVYVFEGSIIPLLKHYAMKTYGESKNSSA